MGEGLVMDVPAGIRIYEFGEFQLHIARQSLYHKPEDRWVPLTPRVFDTLLFLVEHPDELLDKPRMMAAIWPDVIVEENNLDQNISTLRHLLGERRGDQRYIVTVRRRGYRFAAPVRKFAVSDLSDRDRVAAGGASAAETGELPDRPGTTGARMKLSGIAGLTALAIVAIVTIVAMLTLWRGDEQPRAVSLPAKTLATNYTEDAQAYQLYASGRFHRRRGNEEGLRKALEFFHQAVERDPNFAPAYVGLAETYAVLGVFGIVAPHSVFPQARQAVDQALELAPELGEAHASLGHIKVQYEHDWSGAELAYTRAIELNPNYAPVHQWFGIYLSLSGRFDEGLERMHYAQSLEPSSPLYAAMIGMLLTYQRRYDEAIEQLEKTLEMDPALPTAHTYLAMAYLRRGEYDLAIQHLGQSSSLAPGSAAYLGQIYALSGRRSDADAEVEWLIAESQRRYVPAYDIATIYAALGRPDETFAWLERAFDERSQLIGWIPWDPVFDGIRSDPRYPEVARRLNIDTRDE